jgi:hypothetical protein
LAFLLVVIAFPVACAAADQTKIVEWQEEVKLSTGEVIVVERETRFKGGGDPFRGVADLMTIRFRYPPNAKDVIEWRTVRYGDRSYSSPGMSFARDVGPGKGGPHITGYWPEYPLLLDVEQDTKQLVLITNNSGTSEGCNEYFRYRYENGVWRDDILPETFKTWSPNLLLGADKISTPTPITLDFKRKFEADNHRWTRNPHRFRQIGPDRCLCGHIGNPVKSGCAQKYTTTN